jgi:aminomethyltransferase
MAVQVIDQGVFGPTPLTSRLAPMNHGAKWHSWRGFHLPDTYEGLGPELKAVHERAVVEDKSPMNYYSIAGEDASRFLDYLITRDLTRVQIGEAIYAPWLTEDGEVVIDLPVFREGPSNFVTMGGIVEDWLAQHADGFDVQIVDWSDVRMVMPIHGPASRRIVETVTGEDWSDVRFMHGRETTIASRPVWVWRAGYNSQLGFEVHLDREYAADVFDAVWEVGSQFGLMPIGPNAVMVARTEAGIIVPGIDYTRAGSDLNIAAYAVLDNEGPVSPFEIGFGRFVDFDKSAPFIGKEALVAEREAGGPVRTLVGLDVEWRDIVALFEGDGQAPEITRRFDYRRHKVLADGAVVGKATSLCWSPTIRRQIALAQVDREQSAVGTQLEMEWREHGTSLVPERLDDVVSGTIRATVTELPFLTKNKKLRD